MRHAKLFAFGLFGTFALLVSMIAVLPGIAAGAGPATSVLTITNVQVTSITDTTAEVSWLTNELATGQVTYSGNGSGPQTVADVHPDGSTSNVTHLVTISGLSANVTYTFSVSSTDQNGNTVADNNGGSGFTFTTGPTISPPPSMYQTTFMVLTPGSAPAANTLVRFVETSSGGTASETYAGMTDASGNYVLMLPLRNATLNGFVDGTNGTLVATATNPLVITGTTTATYNLSSLGSLPTTETIMLSSGASSFNGGNDQSTSFTLPLLRSDSGYDSVIHLANATTQQTTVGITYYNADGSPSSASGSVILAPLASQNIDVGTSVMSGFDGSAVISASTAIIAAVDVVNPAVTSDNLGSYAGITRGATTAFAPGAKSVPIIGLSSTLDLQNTTSTQANVTLTFISSVSPAPTDSVTVPALGVTSVNVAGLSQVPSGWVGTIQIQSDQPIAAVSELDRSNSYGIVSMSTTTANGSFYLPRFDFNTSGGWLSAAVIQNTASASNNFTGTFYNLDRSVAGTPTTVALNPGQAKTLTGSSSSLPSGFTGSAVITDTQTSAAALALNLFGPLGSFSGETGYSPQTAAPTGGAVALAGLRNNVAGVTTGFALQNTSTATQTYTITYYDTTGAQVGSPEVVTIPPLARWFGSQGDDPQLPAGFTGSARVTTNAGGALPVAIVNEYAGTFSAPASDSGSVLATPTTAPSSTPTTAPSSTPTTAPSSTPTTAPSSTPTTAPSTATPVPSSTPTNIATPTETVEPIETEISVPASGTVTVQTNNQQVTLNIPAGSLEVNGTPLPAGSTVSLSLQPQAPVAMSGARQLLSFQLTLTANGQPITQFASNAPIQITVVYDSAAVAAAGLNVADLQIYLVGTDGTVTALPSTVDTTNHTVTAQIPHLTSIVLGAPARGGKIYIPAAANVSNSGW